ncbi:MAG: galactose mutarotase [Chitinophagaceae bacterium]|nr:MAG: galactose mutarotase [Chitinophagaceae bacterium]
METNQVIGVFILKRAEIEVKISNYGACIMSVAVPDKNGVKANVVAGFDDPADYLSEHPYFGTIVGRVANRLAGASFPLDGRTVQLSLNEKVNQLHGGFEGFDKKYWRVKEHTDTMLELAYTSPDGEEGYPGTLETTVRYTLSPANSLLVEYTATTDKPTIVSLTNHSYFNLSGFESDTIYDHRLKLNADHYTIKNATNTSTGEFGNVKNTALDFHQEKRIGDRIHEMVTDRGYDHNYVLKDGPAPAATLYDPVSGRSLNVYTDQPGVQVYTSNWWDGTIKGSQGKYYQQHGAVALETQGFPDAPNHPSFPSMVLRPGETYHSYTIFEFNAG